MLQRGVEAYLLGIIELTTAALLAAGAFIPWNLTGEFLYKDIVLLCVCVVLFLTSLPKGVVSLRSN